MDRKKMLNHLKSLNITDAVADKNAGRDGSPAILLRWNGAEEYYTGSDMPTVGSDPNAPTDYREWLIKKFGNR